MPVINSVRLYYLKYQGASDLKQLNEQLINQWLSELPLRKQSSLRRFFHDRDRMASLLATRLLNLCAAHEKIEGFRLSDVRYPDRGKPNWKRETGVSFDFNISHSDKMIVVAASKVVKVGIDTEKIRELKNLNFKKMMSVDELTKIQHEPDLFFNLWSKKEAVVKAANTTGLARMRDVKLKQDYALLDEKKWYLKNIELDDQSRKQYAIHLALSQPVSRIIIKQILLNELIASGYSNKT